jgi:hypothetical protein
VNGKEQRQTPFANSTSVCHHIMHYDGIANDCDGRWLGNEKGHPPELPPKVRQDFRGPLFTNDGINSCCHRLQRSLRGDIVIVFTLYLPCYIFFNFLKAQNGDIFSFFKKNKQKSDIFSRINTK